MDQLERKLITERDLLSFPDSDMQNVEDPLLDEGKVAFGSSH